ncbi:3-oxo-5-alpha-steroid 4-dehydrogenase-domain-containing protein [Limtongia smithiae]|uniref:3-oxo-5-alpha-steroid 4-dehydrogenase-domain-containing protein n=1 Tax=Limtongia smithiae TaxID=1125753 RepID=UPI0034CE6642
MVTVNLRTKSPKAKVAGMPRTLEVDTAGTVDSLVAALGKATKLGPERIRLTLVDNTRLVPGTPLEKYDLQEKSIIYVKDLGLQIAWSTVFYFEYAGPIVVHLIAYNASKWFYGVDYEYTKTQTAVYYMMLIHFFKRELETRFVHRFSNATMPIANIFRNSFYYTLLSGFLISYAVYSPVARPDLPPFSFKGLIFFWTWAEFSNFLTHLNLSSLRPVGTTVRKIPVGYGFDLISCPNYFFESMGWLAIALLTRSWAAALTFVFFTATMYNWAVGKHLRYKREFKEKYPKNRKAMFPFIA